MKIHDVIQGSDEWLTIRLGLPTSSRFDQFTTAKGKYRTGQMPLTYMAELIAEDVVTADFDSASTPWMDRGMAMEAEAIAEYELANNVTCQRVGFIESDGAGCSPDALVGDEGLLEVKCPMPKTVVGYLMAGTLPDAYIVQVHGQMAVTGRKWVDFMAYHPELPSFDMRVERDEFTELVAEHLERFKRELAETKARLKL